MRRSLVGLVGFVLACGDFNGDENPLTDIAEIKAAGPTGDKLGVQGQPDDQRSKTLQMSYHGGALMLAPKNLYYIWYGAWADSPVQPILTDLALNLGGSSYFGLVSGYRNSNGVAPTNVVGYVGSINDNYSQSATFSSQSGVGLVVATAVANGQLPADPDGVYVVLLAADVDYPGLCTTSCSFHSTTGSSGVTLKYAAVGNTGRCPSSCAAQSIGPNGTSPADAMASLVAAQVFNTVTDPELTGWYDRGGFEGADKCAWTYGTTWATANGARANVVLGGRDFLLQQLWNVTGSGGNGPRAGSCSLGQ